MVSVEALSKVCVGGKIMVCVRFFSGMGVGSVVNVLDRVKVAEVNDDRSGGVEGNTLCEV